MINLRSAEQLSIFLFGGKIKKEDKAPVLNELGIPVVYKTGERRGQVKTKKITKEVEIKGLGLKPLPEWSKKKAGIYSTDEKVLSKIILTGKNKAKSEKHLDAIKICELLLKLRELQKLESTYFEGFKRFLHKDNLIHGSIVHVQTETGRTSSNKPNLQNVPN